MKYTLAIVGCDAPIQITQSLKNLGYTVISLPPDARLQKPVRSHADMLLCVIDQTVFCSDQYFHSNQEIFDLIKSNGYKIVPCNVKISEQYPYDIAFNLLYVNNFILGNIDFIANEIKEHAASRNIKLVPIKQGYAKCSTLLLDNVALISADNGILSNADKLNLSSLKITNSPDSVALEGYDYGFIGGASGVLEKRVFFSGNIKYHPECHKISEFCERLNFQISCLYDNPLIDVGGIIFLPPVQAHD